MLKIWILFRYLKQYFMHPQTGYEMKMELLHWHMMLQYNNCLIISQVFVTVQNSHQKHD